MVLHPLTLCKCFELFLPEGVQKTSPRFTAASSSRTRLRARERWNLRPRARPLPHAPMPGGGLPLSCEPALRRPRSGAAPATGPRSVLSLDCHAC